MRDFEDSTLWRLSELERVRAVTGSSGFAPLTRDTVLSTTLMADLRRVESTRDGLDLLEVVAACVRHREPALLLLDREHLIWPLTLFPDRMMVHSPNDFVAATQQGIGDIRLFSIDPPGVRPPGHWRNDRVADLEHYRPLGPVLWRLAMLGPRGHLLDEIAGKTAYRALRRDADGAGTVETGSAIGAALVRLHGESATVDAIARWPGMGMERACRMLNALYLTTNLMVLRSPSAVRRPGASWLRLWR